MPTKTTTASTKTIKKESTTMTTKKTAAAKTATTKKESTMTKTATKTDDKPMTKEEKRAAAEARRRAEIDELKAKYDAPAFEDPINFHNILKADFTGKPAAGLWVKPIEVEYLCWVANERGWTNNAFATATQIHTCHGTIPEGEEGIRLYNPNSAPNVYYNYDQVVWENGEGPVYDDEIRKESARDWRERRKASKAKERLLPLPNGVMMKVNLNSKRSLKEYNDACEALKAIVA